MVVKSFQTFLHVIRKSLSFIRYVRKFVIQVKDFYLQISIDFSIPVFYFYQSDVLQSSDSRKFT